MIFDGENTIVCFMLKMLNLDAALFSLLFCTYYVYTLWPVCLIYGKCTKFSIILLMPMPYINMIADHAKYIYRMTKSMRTRHNFTHTQTNEF